MLSSRHAHEGDFCSHFTDEETVLEGFLHPWAEVTTTSEWWNRSLILELENSLPRCFGKENGLAGGFVSSVFDADTRVFPLPGFLSSSQFFTGGQSQNLTIPGPLMHSPGKRTQNDCLSRAL